MPAFLGLLLIVAGPDLGCPSSTPPVFGEKLGFGVTCCADATEATGSGEAWLTGNARCEVYDFRVAAAEIVIKREADSKPHIYDAGLVVEARGDAIAQGLGNVLRGERVVLEFAGNTGAVRLVVKEPHETGGGQTRLLPLSSPASR